MAVITSGCDKHALLGLWCILQVEIGNEQGLTTDLLKDVVSLSGVMQVTSRPTAAIPMENPYCSCTQTRVRSRCRPRRPSYSSRLT